MIALLEKAEASLNPAIMPAGRSIQQRSRLATRLS
jgi:hypothetical protein